MIQDKDTRNQARSCNSKCRVSSNVIQRDDECEQKRWNLCRSHGNDVDDKDTDFKLSIAEASARSGLTPFIETKF